MEALTIPVTIYVMATTTPYLPTSFHSFTCDMSQQYPDLYVLVTTKTVEIAIPALEPIDIIGMQVNALRAKKEQISADTNKQLSIIDDQIQQLLCIDHSPIE
ncbi:hypothetical protein ACR71H_12030 [Klebsiella pneumoniae]|uniref:hypothetical protein n=1 Tax=Klebsiella pneumoniae TaxID=573 RepID=UPI001CBCF2A0|nr:hypothetical protein [Klebsiella pneumoniae]MDK1656433.1 hypothetical protein [Klebsiella pneumoniae]MDL4463857.1 hypothetical protein [Klebsiella pneumoniae]MDL4467697.1 hypothetical protein [Klebsiella pneumoniae]MDQ5329193.1 hypothetical protein [Klebsiella pneumoniae]MDU2637508.1 hypothetical protein [Klebsiella pneumoniae]